MDQPEQNKEAFSLERWAWLKRVAKGLLGSEADAEDLASEMMTFLLSGPQVLIGVEKLEAWLYTLMRRRAVDFIRSQQRRRRLNQGLAQPKADPAPTALGRLEDEELEEAFSRAVKALPPDLAEPFIQNALEGRAFREISERSGIPPGTLMARKQKAVALIREALKKEGFEP